MIGMRECRATTQADPLTDWICFGCSQEPDTYPRSPVAPHPQPQQFPQLPDVRSEDPSICHDQSGGAAWIGISPDICESVKSLTMIWPARCPSPGRANCQRLPELPRHPDPGDSNHFRSEFFHMALSILVLEFGCLMRPHVLSERTFPRSFPC